MSDDYIVDVNVTEDIIPDVDTGDASTIPSNTDTDEVLLSADISPDELIDVELYSDEPINTEVTDTVGSSETDHRLLTHRDAPDQHPMTAITGLNTSLQNMAASIDSRLTADENGIILLQVDVGGHTQRLNVVEGDVVDAAKTATNYVTALSSTGIKLHAEDSATLNYITLDGNNGVEVSKGGKSVSLFGETVRVGQEEDSHINISEGGMELFNAQESAALFGETTRIGYNDEAHLGLDVNGMRGYSSDGGLYFSINRGALGTTIAYEWLNNNGEIPYSSSGSWFSVRLDSTGTISGVTESVYDKYRALATGGRFNIQVTFYAKLTDTSSGRQVTKTVPYSTIVREYQKGTYYSTTNYIRYTRFASSYDIIEIAQSGSAPPLPTGDSTHTYAFRGWVALYGEEQTGYYPFYRFGTDVAETGGASSFVMGHGTKADTANALALGEYNDCPNNAVLMVGRGTSDSLRSNAFTIYNTGDATLYGTLTQSSDRRIKEHISYLGDDAIGFVRALKPVHYIKDNKHHVGFYAQDVEAADVWHCMTGEMNGYKTLGYTELIAPLVAYCQSLEKRIEELESEVK